MFKTMQFYLFAFGRAQYIRAYAVRSDPMPHFISTPQYTTVYYAMYTSKQNAVSCI